MPEDANHIPKKTNLWNIPSNVKARKSNISSMKSFENHLVKTRAAAQGQPQVPSNSQIVSQSIKETAKDTVVDAVVGPVSKATAKVIVDRSVGFAASRGIGMSFNLLGVAASVTGPLGIVIGGILGAVGYFVEEKIKADELRKQLRKIIGNIDEDEIANYVSEYSDKWVKATDKEKIEVENKLRNDAKQSQALSAVLASPKADALIASKVKEFEHEKNKALVKEEEKRYFIREADGTLTDKRFSMTAIASAYVEAFSHDYSHGLLDQDLGKYIKDATMSIQDQLRGIYNDEEVGWIFSKFEPLLKEQEAARLDRQKQKTVLAVDLLKNLGFDINDPSIKKYLDEMLTGDDFDKSYLALKNHLNPSALLGNNENSSSLAVPKVTDFDDLLRFFNEVTTLPERTIGFSAIAKYSQKEVRELLDLIENLTGKKETWSFEKHIGYENDLKIAERDKQMASTVMSFSWNNNSSVKDLDPLLIHSQYLTTVQIAAYRNAIVDEVDISEQGKAEYAYFEHRGIRALFFVINGKPIPKEALEKDKADRLKGLPEPMSLPANIRQHLPAGGVPQLRELKSDEIILTDMPNGFQQRQTVQEFYEKKYPSAKPVEKKDDAEKEIPGELKKNRKGKELTYSSDSVVWETQIEPMPIPGGSVQELASGQFTDGRDMYCVKQLAEDSMAIYDIMRRLFPERIA